MRPGPFSAETRAAWWTLPKSPVTSAASAPPDDSARCRCCRTSWACRPTPKRRDFPFRPTSKRREFARSIYLEKEASNSFGFIAEGGDAAQQRGGVMAVGTRGSSRLIEQGAGRVLAVDGYGEVSDLLAALRPPSHLELALGDQAMRERLCHRVDKITVEAAVGVVHDRCGL